MKRRSGHPEGEVLGEQLETSLLVLFVVWARYAALRTMGIPLFY